MSSMKELLKALLSKVASKDVNNYFAEPVNVAEVPLYYEHIKSPMDFATMHKKLSAGAYHSIDDVSKDFDLIWANCMLFNADDTPFFKEAQRLRRITKPISDAFRKKAKAIKANKSSKSKSSDIADSSIGSLPSASHNRITLKFSSSSNSIAGDESDFSRSLTSSSPRLIASSSSPSLKKPVYRFAMIPPPFQSTSTLVNQPDLAEGSIACLAELARIERSLADISEKKAASIATLPPGPMLYHEYRPLAHVPFDSRYVDRVARYSLGENANKADPVARFLYQQKMDSIITDPNALPVFKPTHDWKPQEAFLDNIDSFRDHFIPSEPYGISAQRLTVVQNLLQKAIAQIKPEASEDVVMKTEDSQVKEENVAVKDENTKPVAPVSRLVQVKLVVSASGSITSIVSPVNSWSSITTSLPAAVLNNASAVIRLISNWQKTKHIKPEPPATPQSHQSSNQVINANRTLPEPLSSTPASYYRSSQSVPTTPQTNPSSTSSPTGSERSQSKKDREREREREREKERLREKERKKAEKERKRAKRKLEEQQAQVAAQQKAAQTNVKPANSHSQQAADSDEQAAKRRRLDDGRAAPQHPQMMSVMSGYQQRPGMPVAANPVAMHQPQAYSQHPLMNSQSSASAAISPDVRLAYTIYATSVKNGKPMTGLQITEALMRESAKMQLKDAQTAVAQLTAILQQREKTRQAALAQQAQHQAAQPTHQQPHQQPHQQTHPPTHQQPHQQAHQTAYTQAHQQAHQQPPVQTHQSINQQTHQPSHQPAHQPPQATHQTQIHPNQPQVVQTQPSVHHSQQHHGQTLHPQAFQLMQQQQPVSTSTNQSVSTSAPIPSNDQQQSTFRSNLSRLAQQAKSMLPDELATMYINSLNELNNITDTKHHQMLITSKYNQLKHLVTQSQAQRASPATNQPINQPINQPTHQPTHQSISQSTHQPPHQPSTQR